MKLSELKQVIVTSPMDCVDFIHPTTGRSLTFGQTLEQVQARYPGAYVTDFETWNANKERALCSAPVAIDEDRFMEMLEILPPQNWQRGKNCESFELSEHTSGRVTSILCRFGDKYFEFQGIAGQSLADIAKMCGMMV